MLEHTRTLSPNSPMEVQAVAGRPLLPHVNVLPHGAVPAAEHRADSSTSQTHLQFGLRRQNHERSPTLLTGQKCLPSTSRRNAASLADCSHHQCLSASPCLHYSFAFPPSPCVVFGRVSWLQRYSWPNSGSICKQMQFCFGHTMMLNFKRRKTFQHKACTETLREKKTGLTAVLKDL